ncbi:MAG: hypothetical protein JM58_05660 [Peptococcaceae bacterium BICA1-8]|nr:MAG: hypothetical protein JM58_05660 [Peptococcaceae bacterium BICA1-8]
MKKGLIVTLAIIVLLLFAAGNFVFTVDQAEQAFLVTLGVPQQDLLKPGLNFKLPYPIQRLVIMSRETFSLTLGYAEDKDGKITTNVRESKMITGDENIILVDLEVQYRITDPIAYTFNTEDPKTILYNISSAALRGIIGSYKVDDALTDGRGEITNDIRDYVTDGINKYNLGITVVGINLQDVDLPNEEVSQAFKQVNDAREERMTKINEANQHKNKVTNDILGEIEAITNDALGQKAERVKAASGDVAKFNAIYEEYINNKNITRNRLTIETLEAILPSAKIYIMDDSSGTVKYLPLDTLRKGE